MAMRTTSMIELRPETLAILRNVAGDWADRFISLSLVPGLATSTRISNANLRDVRTALEHPFWCLHAFFHHYAFARRGKDREELASLACQALRRLSDPDGFSTILQEADGHRLWESFEELCAERKRKPNEQLNRGILAGMLELAQEVYRLDNVGSLCGWVKTGLIRTNHLEPAFLRIVDVRGVGPKTTSMFLRDLVLLLDMEDSLDHADRLYVQPVDRWLRLFAEAIVPEEEIFDAVDWVVAGKVSKYTRRAGVSGIRFNMGASYFGHKEVREPERFEHALTLLVQ
jgi:hypothetical protein